MENPNSREQILNLITQKEKIENEIEELTGILTQNGVGMHDPLVDDEGFPINTIDVYQVRHARHRIICLQNDHKNTMKQIENGLHGYYANPGSNSAQSAMDIDRSETTSETYLIPFAKVNLVSPGSPADHADLRVNDELVEFGSINATNFKNLQDIAAVLQHSEGAKVNVKIKRDGCFITAQLIPRQWPGKGLLGCIIVPI